MVFWRFWVLGPILAHQTAKFEFSGQFCFSRHPWGPWERQSSGVICIWKIYQLTVASPWRIFFTFMKMLPNVSFINMVIKKVFLSLSIAKISTFLQKCTLWRHNFETSQPKIGQCDLTNLLESALLHQIFGFWDRDLKFWLRLRFFKPVKMAGSDLT